MVIMALGSNRDYVKTHKTTMTSMKKAGLINLWQCKECNRKNLYKYENCPRCGEQKNRKEIKK